MGKRIITNWENDLIEEPEVPVMDWVRANCANYEFKLLPGFRHRCNDDIFTSLRESRIIIMQPNLLESNQIASIVTQIGHSIHINFNGATREWDLREFVFLSANPFEDLQIVKDACIGLKDRVNEDPLAKILHSVECWFYGFSGEKYELRYGGYNASDAYAIRYK